MALPDSAEIFGILMRLRFSTEMQEASTQSCKVLEMLVIFLISASKRLPYQKNVARIVKNDKGFCDRRALLRVLDGANQARLKRNTIGFLLH